MRRLFALFAFCLAATSLAEDTYLGLFLQGSKIGYATYSARPEKLGGRMLTRTDSKTVMGAGLLGASLDIQMDSTAWVDAQGRPALMRYAMTSAGRTQLIEARFGAENVTIAVTNTGNRSTKTLPIPKGAPIVDDPLQLVLNGSPARQFYILDPTTATFVTNTIRMLGKGSVTVRGKTVAASILEVVDPRASTKVYYGGKGDLIKVVAPMGIEMIPITKQEALAKPSTQAVRVDLASATSLRTDKPIGDPANLVQLRLLFEGRNMSRVPSDAHQTLNGSQMTWVVSVHPVQVAGRSSTSIEEAAAQKPAWTKPGMHMPSDTPRFRGLAAQIVSDGDDVLTAGQKIRRWVHQQLRPNAGIGVLRDANDVIDTKEGVCRDYAILTGTICRAAGIPTKLVSGLVNWDGTFYYHAWVEVWDGDAWVGLDSTGAQDQVTAAHVKLAEGSVEDAFTFTFLEKAKVTLLGLRRG